MADQSVGTARVDLIVNTEQFQAEINRAKNLSASLGPEFEKSVSKMNPAARKATLDALKLAQQAKLTKEEIRLLSLASRGAAPQALDELAKAFQKTREAAAQGGKELNQYGISAAQQAAALRGVPAQLTDIVVSLQGGQNALTVLLQQGGQLKDMFGGVAPAAKALGGAVLGLVNPFTIAAAGAAAVAYAYHEGSQESDRFRVALTETGNITGQTADELNALAKSSAEVIGSQSRAANALLQVAAGGKVARSVLKEVAEASSLFASATGRDLDDVAKLFTSLSDDTADTAAKLNEQYHFLTASVYEQIRALEEQGRKEEAASLAQRTLADAFKTRAQDIRAEAGSLERAWTNLGNAARQAWDWMLNIGRPTPVEDLRAQATALEKTIAQLESAAGLESTDGGAAVGGGANRAIAARKRMAAELAALQDEITKRDKAGAAARSSALKQEAENAKIAGAQAYKAYVDSRKGATLASALQAESEAFAKATKTIDKSSAEYRQALTIHNAKVADIQKQFANKGKGAAVKDDAATRMLAEFNQGNAVLLAQVQSREKLGTWEQRSLKFEQEIADLKEKRILTADQKSILARQDELRAALQRNVATERSIRLEEDKAKVLALQQTLQTQLATDRQRYDDEQAAFGLGGKEQERVRERIRIYRDYQKDLDRITQQRTTNRISETLFQQESEAYKRNLADRLAALEDHYQKTDQLEGQWLLGARGGLLDYSDEAANVAGMTRDAFSSAFQGMEDALVDFVSTGKLSFADLAKSILSDIARISIRQGITGPLSGLLGTALSGLFGGITAGSGFTSGGVATGGAGAGGTLGAFTLLGGRASGGPTQPGGFYEVNEKGPELYTEGGRTFLMSGARGGYVTPLTAPVGASSGGARVSVHNYAGVEVQARQMSDGEILLEIDRRIDRNVPRKLESQLKSSNSRGSRALTNNFRVERNL